MSIFKCKQFAVEQSDDVYKLTSDTTLIGAWAQLAPGNATLEVGCGSGMISLMLAQRYPDIEIHAIDINPSAVTLCQRNFSNSPWSDRLSASHGSFEISNEHDKGRYDNIISNPPYHNSTTLPPNDMKAAAKHDSSLSFEQLINTSAALLKETGMLHVIIPTDRSHEFITIASNSNLYPSAWCEMLPRSTKPAKRSLLSFHKKGTHKVPTHSITMYDTIGHHTDFTHLLKPFLIIF